jgi:hypothetical protein
LQLPTGFGLSVKSWKNDSIRQRDRLNAPGSSRGRPISDFRALFCTLPAEAYISFLNMEITMAGPRVFVSYSWESEDHRSWVRALAQELVSNGIDVRLDQWHVRAGDSLTQFMELEVTQSDFVVVVCTPAYARKANARTGGVGYEQQIVSGQLLANTPRRKFIPILRSGNLENGNDCAVPASFLGILTIDFRSDANFQQSFEELVRTILGRPRLVPPPLGVTPALPAEQDVSQRVVSQDSAPPDPTKRLLFRYVNQHNFMLDLDGYCYRTIQYCLENTTGKPLASYMMGDTSDLPLSISEFNLRIADETGVALRTEFSVDTPNYKRWDTFFRSPLMPGERARFFAQYYSCDVGKYQGQHTQRVQEGVIHYVLLREVSSNGITVAVRDERGWRDVEGQMRLFELPHHRVVLLPYRKIESVYQFRIQWS